MKYDESLMPDDVTPNEVGQILISSPDGNEYRGLLIVSMDSDVPPVELTKIPSEIVDEYHFTMTVSPYMAHFLGALQAKEMGTRVPEEVGHAAVMLWWLLNEYAQMRWKEIVDE